MIFDSRMESRAPGLVSDSRCGNGVPQLQYYRVPLRQVPGLTCWCLTLGILPEFRVNWFNSSKSNISYQGQSREFRVDSAFQGGFMIGSRVEIQFSKLIPGSRADTGFKI